MESFWFDKIHFYYLTWLEWVTPTFKNSNVIILKLVFNQCFLKHHLFLFMAHLGLSVLNLYLIPDFDEKQFVGQRVEI